MGNLHNASTDSLQQLDALHHLHPFTDTVALNRKGTRVIKRAQGVYLWDTNDNKYLDGMAGLWCVNVGYGRKEICLLYTSPSPRDGLLSRMPSSA